MLWWSLGRFQHPLLPNNNGHRPQKPWMEVDFTRFIPMCKVATPWHQLIIYHLLPIWSQGTCIWHAFRMPFAQHFGKGNGRNGIRKGFSNSSPKSSGFETLDHKHPFLKPLHQTILGTFNKMFGLGSNTHAGWNIFVKVAAGGHRWKCFPGKKSLAPLPKPWIWTIRRPWMIASHLFGGKIFPTQNACCFGAKNPESSADANPKIFKVRMLTQTVRTLVLPCIPNSSWHDPCQFEMLKH